jgi:hypothetical protein
MYISVVQIVTVQVALDPMRPDSKVGHVSHIDYSWEVDMDGGWEKFMIMELKRPGVLRLDEWQNAFSGQGVVKGYGEKCCRQTIKYAYSYDVPVVGICDGLSMVILELDRSRKDWWFDKSGAVQPIRARGSWVRYENLKKALYIFMKYALKHHLVRCGKTIVQ